MSQDRGRDVQSLGFKDVRNADDAQRERVVASGHFLVRAQEEQSVIGQAIGRVLSNDRSVASVVTTLTALSTSKARR